MMKKTSGKIALFLGLAALTNLSFGASEAHYGLPNKTNLSTDSTAKRTGYVVLRNFTYDRYMAYATFRPSRDWINLPLEAYGSGRDVITYDINDHDNEVCLNVVRSRDGKSVFNDCVQPGYDVNIGPYKTSINAAPKVTVTHNGM